MPDEPAAPHEEQKLPAQITSPGFQREVKRIAENWFPGNPTIG